MSTRALASGLAVLSLVACAVGTAEVPAPSEGAVAPSEPLEEEAAPVVAVADASAAPVAAWDGALRAPRYDDAAADADVEAAAPAPYVYVPPHRAASPEACAPVGTFGAGDGWDQGGEECRLDSDCTAQPGGHCAAIQVGNPTMVGRACEYDNCSVDADCPAGSVCACGRLRGGWARANACVGASCRVDADCGPGGYCVPEVWEACVTYVLGYTCMTPLHACTGAGCVLCADAGDHLECPWASCMN